MAVRRKLAGLADTLLKAHLQKVNQERQYGLQRENQDAAAQQAQQYRMLDAGLNDQSGSIFDKLKKAGISKIGDQDITGLAPTMDDAVGGVGKQIQQDPNKWDPMSIIGAVKSAPGGAIDEQAGPQISQLINQRNQAMELKRNSAPMVNQKFINDQGVPSERFVNPNNADPVQAELTGAQKGAEGFDQWQGNEGNPARLATEVSQAGKKSGAEAAANFPWQMKLAQTRADMSLMNQQEMDQWRTAHPKATAAMLDRRSKATSAVSLANDMQTMLDEMDKRQMVGPLAGRGYEIAEGKIKSEDLFANPDDAKLAAQYFSTAALLQSLAANVHFGQRGAGSAAGLNHFKQVISGVGDKSIVQGQLDTVKRLMQHYQEKPDEAEAPLEIPGGLSGAPTPLDGVDPSILQLLQRGQGPR